MSQAGPSAAPQDATAADAQAGDELAEARRQRDENLDQLQRTRAEFANFQRRSRENAEKDRQYAAGPLALDLIAVLDNFERAQQAAKSSGASSIVEGLDMVHRQLLAALAKHGIEPIDAHGGPFDPNVHEALLQQPAPDVAEGTVVAELARGYRLRDRVLRPSKVAVSVKSAD